MSNSKIWAWIVTSKAVVGSSAITSFGRQIKAMAIMARCRIPPESSWGVSLVSPLRLVDTHPGQHLQDLPAEFFCRQRFFRGMDARASPICRPIFITGLRLVMGSWKIRLISPAEFNQVPMGSCQRSFPGCFFSGR